jgi:hypothetical protein
MRRHFLLPALATPLILAACLDPETIPDANYGVIGLTAVVSTNDTILAPEAQFYRTGLLGLPTSRVFTDQCLVAVYPTPTESTQRLRYLDAGDSVAVSTTASTKYIFPTVDGEGDESYVLRTTERLPFHPGDAVTVTVPGAAGGFANGTVSVITARGFTLGPIEAHPLADEGLDITWTPAGDDSTKMLLSLQYGVGEPLPNQQIFCSLIDDGAAEIPAFLLTQYRNAITGSRRVEAARWRVAAIQVNDGFLVAISAFAIEEDVVD